MKLTNVLQLFYVFFICSFFALNSGAATIPSGQDVGATIQQVDKEKTKEAVSKSLQEGKKKAEVEGQEKVEAAPAQPTGPTQKVLIKKIEVVDVTLLNQKDIAAITTSYEGKELSLGGFREIADKITDLYRRQGYATSFAFVRPQKIENNTLVISTLEGKIGTISISGNKWFTTKFLMNYLDSKKDSLFNYDMLKENLRQMNEHPDVNGRAVLSRGQTPGTTDVEVQVKDHLPLHATLGYNNYNSTYLDRNKYSLELKSTNFTGHGDIFSTEFQKGESDFYSLESSRYLLPLSIKTSVGGYYLHVNQSLGRSLKSAAVKGSGDILNIYGSYKLVNHDNFSFSVSPAFNYKNVKNIQAGRVTGKDYTRVATLGFDLDTTDSWKGRNIVTQQFDFGIPDMMGGLAAKDDRGSRRGSAGQFFRTVTNAARVQVMPFSTVLMLKGSGQFSHYNLPSSEQFQVGGYYTVRGYPVSEISGDKGLTISSEWYIPFYFLPQDKHIFHTNTSWREAFSLVGFFDWGSASNNHPRTGEIKKKTIYGAGAGLRFNLSGSAYMAFDYGFPVGDKPSTGSRKGIAYIETKIFF